MPSRRKRTATTALETGLPGRVDGGHGDEAAPLVSERDRSDLQPCRRDLTARRPRTSRSGGDDGGDRALPERAEGRERGRAPVARRDPADGPRRQRPGRGHGERVSERVDAGGRELLGPSSRTVAVAGVTASETTGPGVTVTVCVPLVTPSADAVSTWTPGAGVEVVEGSARARAGGDRQRQRAATRDRPGSSRTCPEASSSSASR